MTGCTEGSVSTKVSTTKLSAEEQGVLEHLEKALEYIVKHYNATQESARKYAKYQKENNPNAAARQLKKYHSSLNQLTQLVLAIRGKKPNPRRLIFPNSMHELRNALYQFRDLKYHITDGSLDSNQRTLLLDAAKNVYLADKSLAAIWKQRSQRYATLIPEWNYSVQNSMFPLKLAYNSNGGFNIRYSQKLGPVSVVVSGGTSRGSGIKKLIIQNSRYFRVFAVGQKRVEHQIPASLLVTEGDKMTITFNEDHADYFISGQSSLSKNKRLN